MAQPDESSDGAYDDLTALLADPVYRVLDRLWSRALDSQSEDFVDATGAEGPMDEDTYIRYKTNSLRITRQELDELRGRTSKDATAALDQAP